MGQITLDPLPIDHQVSSCLLFGFILKLGLCFLSLAISFFSFIPVLHVLFSFCDQCVFGWYWNNVVENSRLLQDLIG
jgi:hypothetical protein